MDAYSKQKSILKSTLVITAVVLLTGCTTAKPPVMTNTDSASVQIAEAASSISQSLTDLKAIQKASAPPINNKYLAYPTSGDLDEVVSVDWSGPIGGIFHRAAQISGFTPRVIGVPPAIPVLVTISVRNTPLSYVLRDANFQAGSKASIVVYPGIRVIDLRYGKA